MKHARTLLCWLRWLAILLCMSGLFAWLISAHLAPRPLASVWWPCLIGSVIASVFLVTQNLVEGGCVVIILLMLGFLVTGVLAKHDPAEAAAWCYILPSAILTGFLSTRGVFYPRFFS